MLSAIALRERISARVAEALIARDERVRHAPSAAARRRPDPEINSADRARDADLGGDDAEIRGALLGRDDLPASARLLSRRGRRCRHAAAPASSRAPSPRRGSTVCCATPPTPRSPPSGRARRPSTPSPSPAELVASEKLSARVMLHALVNGHVLFFADCIATLAEIAARKSLHPARNRQPPGAQRAARPLRPQRGGAQPHCPADLPRPRRRPCRRRHRAPFRRHCTDRGTDRRA